MRGPGGSTPGLLLAASVHLALAGTAKYGDATVTHTLNLLDGDIFLPMVAGIGVMVLAGGVHVAYRRPAEVADDPRVHRLVLSLRAELPVVPLLGRFGITTGPSLPLPASGEICCALGLMVMAVSARARRNLPRRELERQRRKPVHHVALIAASCPRLRALPRLGWPGGESPDAQSGRNGDACPLPTLTAEMTSASGTNGC